MAASRNKDADFEISFTTITANWHRYNIPGW